ncbi:MAG: cache domain-containing protein [Bradyrhizobiaceae bacterium]|nr:cache domain-containing protein [Bradyrhizobiaceae bacterium]
MIGAWIIGASLIGAAAAFPPPLRAAEFGTREEAVAMVRRVQEKFRKEGPEATFRAINNAKSGFVDRDLYVFAYTMDGLCVANGQTPAVRNKNLYDMKDQDGKFLIQEFIKIASNPPGHGWSDYRWPNPVTRTIEDKSAWIERMGDYFVGVGIYKNEQINENTVGVISGSPNSDDTYLQMAYDLADVLNDGDNLRILPIAGIGGPRNIRDVRYLRGVDIGLTQTNILNSFRRSNQQIGQYDDKIVYIAKLFNEEVHLIARRDITSIGQLRGRKVNLDAKGSGTSYSMRDLFKTFGIEVEEVSMSQIEALEKVKSGEIAATALIAGKPVRSMSKLTAQDGLHFVALPYPAQLIGDYMPASLTHDDYPELVGTGETVDTVAVGAVMIAYNWPKTGTDRYRRVERFVQAFFPKIAEFQKPPRHVKWREVNIAASLPNWTRFAAAQEWLDNHRQDQMRGNAANTGQPPADRVATIPRGTAAPAVPSGNGGPLVVDPALYEEFMRWRQNRGQ